MSTNFKTDSYYCRKCGARGFEKGSKRKGPKGKGSKDKVEANLNDIQNLQIHRPLLSHLPPEQFISHGIHREFIFDGLPGIDRWNLLPLDVMHELPEGVLPQILNLILTSISKRKDVPRTVVADMKLRLKNFPFYESGLQLSKKGFKIRASAIKV